MMFRIVKSVALGFSAFLLSSSAVWAIVGDATISKILNTSSLYAEARKSYHACIVTNVSTSNVTVKIDLIDQYGDTLISSGPTTTTINAGTNVETSLGENETFTGFARRRILVYSGNADEIPANESVFYYLGTYFATIAFSEAR